MARFADQARFGAIAEVEAYWQALRAGRLVPRRSDIDPRGIERALEYAFVLERIAAGLARLRIAGTHLSDLMGMEVRGMPLSTFFTPESRAQVGEVLEQVFDSPAIATLTLTAERGIGKPALEGKVILLPLMSDLGDVTRVLGCLATQGAVGRAPRRFEITGVETRPLLGDAALGLAPEEAVEAPAPDPRDLPAGSYGEAARGEFTAEAEQRNGADRRGLAEQAITYRGPERRQGDRRVAHLRLVRSDGDDVEE
ncbi:PAS domain-containing protein [Pseudooceanicola nanhaiensis]|uniref:PAS domain-containing protein n=1 Tax=Pseudooceanicola nanhaiensis TaxID=375761 RepID=UPI001CD39A34|nr:PAS domain-containing protein [Pseudooceanicola nanhaiensis]MCA0920718.1 PAS domain-containing protein [Pseudooceanicola nanhaiensis]